MTLSSKSDSKPLSFSTKPLSKPSPSSSLGKRSRPALHHDSDSDDEKPVKHQSITGFDSSGAVTEIPSRNDKQKEALPYLKNKDWRDELKKPKGKNLLPAEVQARIEAASRGGGESGAVDVVNAPGSEPKWGLTINKKETNGEEQGEQKVSESSASTELARAPKTEKTDDEKAIDALMGIKQKEGPDLVIPSAPRNGTGENGRLTEDEAYQRATRDAPDVSSLEDYERVGVEEFGAALLRGMGWNGEKSQKQKTVAKRPNRLGLGAKELEHPEELGAWDQKPRRRVDTKSKMNEHRDRRDRHREMREESYSRDDRRTSNGHRDRDRDRRR